MFVLCGGLWPLMAQTAGKIISIQGRTEARKGLQAHGFRPA